MMLLFHNLKKEEEGKRERRRDTKWCFGPQDEVHLAQCEWLPLGGNKEMSASFLQCLF